MHKLKIAGLVILTNKNYNSRVKYLPYYKCQSKSYTGNKIAFAFCNRQIGIDIERLNNRKIQWKLIIKKHFHLLEIKKIHNFSDFLHYWTAKESLFKFHNGDVLFNKLMIYQDKNNFFYSKYHDQKIFFYFIQYLDYLICYCY